VKSVDIGSDFSDSPSKFDESPTSCGDPAISTQVPPVVRTGNDATNGQFFFQEVVLTFDSEADANETMTLFEHGFDCPNPTIQGGAPVAATGPDDVASLIDNPVDQAFQFTVQVEEAQGVLVAVRMGNSVAVFQFVMQNGADSSTVPSPDDLVNLGVSRLLAG